ncbi:MAG: magnesium protoporphyrin IX methyltransferase [Pseudomonadota bacterium]
MAETYNDTRDRLQVYFNRTAAKTWERLTSDAPVSRIRQTVREGRDGMRARLLSALPQDLSGARVLDAGAGAGSASIELAKRGAEVVAVDISESLLEVARRRTPRELAPQISYCTGDMLSARWGSFTHVFAMDSLIHYNATDIALALDKLSARTSDKIVFTVAPKTALLSAMHLSGKLFPRSDRSPAIVPVREATLGQALSALGRRTPRSLGQEARGFYISHALELCP